jgi:hypothetical protein
MIESMDSVSTLGRMVVSTRANGLTENSMAKAFTDMRMARSAVECGRKAKELPGSKTLFRTKIDDVHNKKF